MSGIPRDGLERQGGEWEGGGGVARSEATGGGDPANVAEGARAKARAWPEGVSGAPRPRTFGTVLSGPCNQWLWQSPRMSTRMSGMKSKG
jgi:hypothetical protein